MLVVVFVYVCLFVLAGVSYVLGFCFSWLVGYKFWTWFVGFDNLFILGFEFWVV